jgi:cellulose synthase (UDP-forming)
VPHHAKAGNINSAILRAGAATGDFVLVLDCDMIVHPEFLQRTLGHFYTISEEPSRSSTMGGRLSSVARWVLKPKAAFLQVPQDFWNVEAADPLGHCARFFYGPMLQVSLAPGFVSLALMEDIDGAMF